MAVAPGTKLFGTDGVRGVAGEFLTAELAFALGRARRRGVRRRRRRRCSWCATRGCRARCSRRRCAPAIAAAGGQALLAGVLPTPAASILVRRYGFDMGVVISASHNPFHDNGIKFFDAPRAQAVRRGGGGDRGARARGRRARARRGRRRRAGGCAP